MKTIKIKELLLKNPLILAPMAGHTDLPFRTLCRKFGASLAYTEMVSAAGMIHGNKKTMEMMRSSAEDKPLGIQLFGSDPKILAQAAKIAASEGAEIIDLNCGCPVKKVTKQEAGSALMKNPDKLARIVSAMAEAVDIPVTVKLRAGQDEEHITVFDVVEKLKNAGLAAVTVHPRTVADPFKSKPKWEILKQLKEQFGIPVIGSGGLEDAEKVKEMLDMTNIDGAMIARGALGHPWVFGLAQRVLSGETHVQEPSIEEKKEVMKEHLSAMVSLYGETHACRLFRSHAQYYTEGWPFAARLRAQLMQLISYVQLEEILTAHSESVLCKFVP
jgi:tRNA-dihydrouridine synthase B